jgi:hypothetical protein
MHLPLRRGLHQPRMAAAVALIHTASSARLCSTLQTASQRASCAAATVAAAALLCRGGWGAGVWPHVPLHTSDACVAGRASAAGRARSGGCTANVKAVHGLGVAQRPKALLLHVDHACRASHVVHSHNTQQLTNSQKKNAQYLLQQLKEE